MQTDIDICPFFYTAKTTGKKKNMLYLSSVLPHHFFVAFKCFIFLWQHQIRRQAYIMEVFQFAKSGPFIRKVLRRLETLSFVTLIAVFQDRFQFVNEIIKMASMNTIIFCL